MGEGLLSVLPGVLVQLIVPAGAIVVVGLFARERARLFGIVGFAIMALGTLINGIVSGLLPMIMQASDLPVSVVGPLFTGTFVVFNTVSVIFLVLAIVHRPRPNPGPGMPS